jgi:aspartyl-tRNA(Asn)/glutamyl-tRNA(Gln) amidotransferase subunit B
MLRLIDKGLISGKIAKKVFDEMAKTGKQPKQIVEEKGLVQVTDRSEIENIVVKIVSDNPKEAEAYKNGKTKILGFFVGQIMRETRGKANPQIVNEILKEKLK